jgi:cell shape-determining protein MreD
MDGDLPMLAATATNPRDQSVHHVWRTLLPLLTAYAAYVLEASGVGRDVSGVEPRWLWLATAAFVWLQPLPAAVLCAGLCGLLSDSITGLPLGRELALFAVVAWLTGVVRRQRRWQSLLAFLFLTCGLTATGVLGEEVLRQGVDHVLELDLRRTVMLAGAQGVLTALWGAGFWGFAALAGRVIAWVLPPVAWRPGSAG